MATTPQTAYEPTEGAPSDLQEKARRHLWMHFTRRVVVFPDPDGPSSVKNSPRPISRSTPSTAATSP